MSTATASSAPRPLMRSRCPFEPQRESSPAALGVPLHAALRVVRARRGRRNIRRGRDYGASSGVDVADTTAVGGT